MNKIQSLSQKMQLVFETLLILAPMITISYWTFYEFFEYIGMSWFSFEFYNQPLTINYKSKILAILITFIPTSIIMYGIFKLKKLFHNYSMNRIFTTENVMIYRKLSITLFALALGNIFTTPLLSLALSFQNPVGSRFVTVSFGTTEILTLLVGFIVMTISYVMKKGAELELEASTTI